GVGWHLRNEIGRVERTQLSLSATAGHHRYMIDVRIVYHRIERPLSITCRKFMRSVLIPQFTQAPCRHAYSINREGPRSANHRNRRLNPATAPVPAAITPTAPGGTRCGPQQVMPRAEWSGRHHGKFAQTGRSMASK